MKLGKALKLLATVTLILACAFIAFVLYATRDEIGATRDTIESELSQYLGGGDLAGFSVAVFDAEEVIYSQGFGFADIEKGAPYTTGTRQFIASVSKTVIGIALLRAEELGLLSLKDPVEQHLGFELRNPKFPADEITLAHLATHTSSLDYNEAVVESLYLGDAVGDPSLKRFMEDYFLRRSIGEIQFHDSPPGTQWSYSNIGSALAAYVIELASGMPFSEFTRLHIFDPLGMAGSSWFQHEKLGPEARYYEVGADSGLQAVETSGVALYPARDLLTDVEDLTRLGQAVLSRDPSLLSSTSYERLLAPRLSSSVSGRDVDNSGVFWMIDRNQFGVTYSLTGMNGGDNCINTWLWLDLKTQMGFAFVGNTGPSPENRIEHILIFQSLVSLGDNTLLNDPERSTWNKLGFRWHNLSSRILALF